MQTVARSPMESASWRKWALGALVAIAALVVTARYALATWHARAPWTATYPYTNDVLTDFRDTVMLPGLAIRSGVNPYNISTYHHLYPFAQEFDPYAPWWLSLTQPFSRLSWRSASLAYACVTAALTALLAAFSGAAVAHHVQSAGDGDPNQRSWRRPLDLLATICRSPWLLGLCFSLLIWVWRPTSLGLGLGNLGAIAALLAVLAVVAPSPSWSVIFAALAWVKPQFGIPLVFVMVGRGQWKRGVCATLLTGALSIPMTYRLAKLAGGLWPLVTSTLNSVSLLSSRTGGEPFAGRVDLTGALASLGLQHAGSVPLVVGSATAILAGWVQKQLAHLGRPAAGALLAGLAILFGFPHIHYDLALLLPVVGWGIIEMWLVRASPIATSGQNRWISYAVGTATAIIVSVCLFPFQQLGLRGALFQAWGVAISTLVTLLVALVACLRCGRLRGQP